MANFLCFIFCLAFLNLTNAVKLPDAPSPSDGDNLNKAQPPPIRKQGMFEKTPALESESPETEGNVVKKKEVSSSDRRSSSDSRTVTIQVEDGDSRKHHRSIDKSIAGGGVIIGGLATTFLVSVFCYIRATRKQALDSPCPA